MKHHNRHILFTSVFLKSDIIQVPAIEVVLYHFVDMFIHLKVSKELSLSKVIEYNCVSNYDLFLYITCVIYIHVHIFKITLMHIHTCTCIQMVTIQMVTNTLLSDNFFYIHNTDHGYFRSATTFICGSLSTYVYIFVYVL